VLFPDNNLFSYLQDDSPESIAGGRHPSGFGLKIKEKELMFLKELVFIFEGLNHLPSPNLSEPSYILNGHTVKSMFEMYCRVVQNKSCILSRKLVTYHG
jgi:hypothetical protein